MKPVDIVNLIWNSAWKSIYTQMENSVKYPTTTDWNNSWNSMSRMFGPAHVAIVDIIDTQIQHLK